MSTKHLSLLAIAATMALIEPACGSSEQSRRPDDQDDDSGAGSGGRASGGSTASGGKATGGAPGSGGVATGGSPSSGGSADIDASAGGEPTDAGNDVSVPDDSGNGSGGTSADSGEIIIPTVDAGAGCEPPLAVDPITPAEAGLPATGLVTWLRGDRGVYKTAANEVCAWVDQSGKQNVFRANLPTTRPTWSDSVFADRPGIRFLANTPLGIGSTLVSPPQSARTYVAVQRHAVTTSRFEPLYTGNVQDNHSYIGIDANTFNHQGNFEGVYAHGNAYDSDLPTSTEVRMHVYVVGPMTIGTPIIPSVQYRVNHFARTLTRTPGGTGNGNHEDFSVAQTTWVGLGGPQADTSIAEILVYDRALSDQEVNAVENALGQRYSIPDPRTFTATK